MPPVRIRCVCNFCMNGVVVHLPRPILFTTSALLCCNWHMICLSERNTADTIGSDWSCVSKSDMRSASSFSLERCRSISAFRPGALSQKNFAIFIFTIIETFKFFCGGDKRSNQQNHHRSQNGGRRHTSSVLVIQVPLKEIGLPFDIIELGLRCAYDWLNHALAFAN